MFGLDMLDEACEPNGDCAVSALSTHASLQGIAEVDNSGTFKITASDCKALQGELQAISTGPKNHVSSMTLPNGDTTYSSAKISARVHVPDILISKPVHISGSLVFPCLWPELDQGITFHYEPGVVMTENVRIVIYPKKPMLPVPLLVHITQASPFVVFICGLCYFGERRHYRKMKATKKLR
jgi:hypothetical protein